MATGWSGPIRPMAQSKRWTPQCFSDRADDDGLVRDCATRGLVPATSGAHTLRHTFATRYLAAHPGDLVGVASLLGHSSLDTTRIYVQLTAEQLAERVEGLDLNAYT